MATFHVPSAAIRRTYRMPVNPADRFLAWT